MDLVEATPSHNFPVSRKIEEAASDINNNSLEVVKSNMLTQINRILPAESSDCGTRSSNFRHDSSQQQSGRHLDSMISLRTRFYDHMKESYAIIATIHTQREIAIKSLLSDMVRRQTAIAIVSVKDDSRQKNLEILRYMKLDMNSQERMLATLETQLAFIISKLKPFHAALIKLEKTMAALRLGSHLPALPGSDPIGVSVTEQTVVLDNRNTYTSGKPRAQVPEAERGAFWRFKKLPAEIREYVWEASLPGPRLLTQRATYNKTLAALATCQDSRRVAQSRYIRTASPMPYFPVEPPAMLYVDPDVDIVIRDLTARDKEEGPLFSRNRKGFDSQCYHMLAGLSSVKHLALAFNLLREDERRLFHPVQASCPSLESLTFFPSSLVPIHEQRDASLDIRLVEVDSNLLDYISFRWDRLTERRLKRRAQRGVTVVFTLLSRALQYRESLAEYISRYGQCWNPIIRVCILVRWNPSYQAWQTQPLDGDRCSGGFRAEDGTRYDGFVESEMIGDWENGLYSRYDGLAALFQEDAMKKPL